MSKSLARITFMGSNLYLIETLTRPTDPGFGNRPPVDPGWDGSWGGGDRPDNSLPGFGHPDQGLPGYGHPDQGLPGYGHPDQGLPGYGHPSHPLPVPPPEGVATPPIVLPDRPQLPAGSGVVVPLPEGVRPEPKADEPPPAADAKPYVLWFGPGTKSSIVWLKPVAPAVGPK